MVIHIPDKTAPDYDNTHPCQQFMVPDEYAVDIKIKDLKGEIRTEQV